MEGLGFFIIIGSILLYFLPTIIANNRKRDNLGAIAVLNLLAGWTGIGWLVALLWSMTKTEKTTTVINNESIELSDELKNLAELKDKGILTEEQFEEAKQKILKK